MRMEPPSATTETVATPARLHNDPKSVIIVRVKEMICTCITRLCVRGLNKIGWSVPRAAAGLVFAALATVRPFVTSTSCSVLTHRLNDGMRLEWDWDWTCRACLDLCLSCLVPHLPNFPLPSLAFPPTSRTASTCMGNHRRGTPCCRFIRHGRGSSLIVEATNLLTSFREGRPCFIGSLAQDLAIRSVCVLEQHRHPVFFYWLPAL